MSSYNENYFIALRVPGDDQIYLKADKKTAQRRFRHKKVVLGGPPLVFHDAYRDDRNNWPVTDVLVDSSGLLVTDSICNEIKKYEIDSVQFVPSVFVDDLDKTYGGRWFVGFYDELNCLDRGSSEIKELECDDEDMDEDDDECLEVSRYSLDAKILDLIEEEKRLMFKISNCSKKYIFVHKKIVDYFFGNDIGGVRFIKVASFKEGMQHQS